jgi:hypothetical protein
MSAMSAIPSLVMGLLQSMVSLNAPYNSAKAQTYATKEMFNNLKDYRAIDNASQPKLHSPYLTIDEKGNTVWHSPALPASGPMSSTQLDPNYLTRVLAKQTKGAKTKLDNPEPSLIEKAL